MFAIDARKGRYENSDENVCDIKKSVTKIVTKMFAIDAKKSVTKIVTKMFCD